MADSSLFISPPPGPQPVTGLGHTFPPKSITTLGDAVAATTGQLQNGTLFTALSANTHIDNPLADPNANSVLAANLNPAVDLQASTSLQVTDFVNTSPNAFPPLTPPPTAPPVSTSTTSTDGTTTTSTTPSSAPSTPDNFSSNQGAIITVPDTGTSTSVYSAVASASAPTIRGSSINVAV